jgi:peptidoglycan/LPS O-acetylase OafA/YrhL
MPVTNPSPPSAAAVAEPGTATPPRTGAGPDAARGAEAAGGSGGGPVTRLAVLDGLRLVAALAVVLNHYTASESIDGVHPPQWHLPTLAPIGYYGMLGVELFFLISGFVICMSSWGRGLGDFVTSRISRLFPAFWFAVLLTAAVVTLVPIGAGWSENGPPSATDVLVNLTMLNKAIGVRSVDAVYWTLFVELRFYLLFAAVVWFGVTYRRVVFFGLAWLTVTVLAPLLDNRALDAVVQPNYAPYFVAGITMFLMHRFGPNLVLWAMVALSWVLSMQMMPGRIGAHDPGWPVSHAPAKVLVTLAFLAVLVVALGWTDRIRWRWLTVAGALTYPLYLLHQRIGYVIMRRTYEAGLDIPIWAILVGTAVFMLLLAYAVHRIVERPLSRLLRDALRRSLADIRAGRGPRTGPRTGPAAPQGSAGPQGSAAPQHQPGPPPVVTAPAPRPAAD